MCKKSIASFAEFTRTKLFVQITMLLGILMLVSNIFYQYKWVGQRTYINKKTITTAIASILNEHSSACSQWIDARLDSLYLDRLWQLGHSNSQYEKQTSIFLFDKDSMVYWSYSIYSGDITDQLINAPSTMMTLDSNQVLVYNFWEGRKSASLVIKLYDNSTGYNPYIFENTHITLHPCDTSYVPLQDDIVINVENTPFIIEPHIRELPPLSVSLIGWAGVLLILLSIRRYARLRTTRLNSLLVSGVVLVILLIIRWLTYHYGIPTLGKYLPAPDYNEMFSMGNLLISFIFVLVYIVYIFSIRYKIKWKLMHCGRMCNFIIFIICVFLANLVIIYFHYAAINIVYNSDINTELYDLYAVNLYGVMFYIIAGVFLTMLVLTNRLGNICFSNYSFLTKFMTGVIILTLMIIPSQEKMHYIVYPLLIFYTLFMGLGLLRRKLSEQAMYLASLAVVTIYIAYFTTTETSTVNDMDSKEYSQLILNRIDDENILNNPKYSNITHTVFSNQGMETKSGNNINIQSLMPYVTMQNDTTISIGKYRHVIAHSRDMTVIASRQETSLLDSITLYVYIFILLYLISTALLRLVRYNKRSSNWSKLAVRIRTVILGLVFFIMFAIMLVVVNYSLESYDNGQRQIVNNNGRNLIRSFNTYAAAYQGDPRDILNEWYINSGSSFYFPICLYDLDGFLINQPYNFNHHKVLSRIGSEAFRAIRWNNKPYFSKYYKTHNESYTSSYLPMYYKGRRLGYVNFIYYDHVERQSNPKFVLLNNILNTFVIFLSLSLILSLFLYRQITTPLKKLHDALRNVSQMQKIPIDESREISDEVGELALQYNLMIDYLTESYAQLARSEREGAWREMALQVAHEIKNPLTPMRLKIQMLQMARQKGDPKFEERLDTTLVMLLDQIDMLSKIATDFSDFARLSEGTPKHINLGNMLKNVSELYINYKNIEVRFQQDSSSPIFVNADYQQLSRVIVNLCQNSIQAIGDDNFGLITIRLSKQGKFAQIEVTDNGKGIPIKVRSKIFLPSFTTKTGGSGLGLAISKEILKTLGATIEFDSVMGVGTTFTIRIPIVK